MSNIAKTISIKNKKAYFEYFLLEEFTAGIQLTGTEIKSVREGRVNLRDSYVQIRLGQAWLMNVHIAPYAQGSHANPDPRRDRTPRSTKSRKSLIGRNGRRARRLRTRMW